MKLMKYTIFSTPTCHYCHLLKNWLTENNIPYEVRDVATDLEARKLMVSKSQQMGVPVSLIEVVDDTGKTVEHVVVGFAQMQIGKLIGLDL
ncbi:MAG: glutaredoxin domain-containing protein [Patescibacteria group bacterium]|jgi:glutaredoxin